MRANGILGDASADGRVGVVGIRRILKARALTLALAGIAGAFATPAVASADQWFKTDVHVHTVLSSDAAEDLGILKNIQRVRATTHSS